MGRWRPAASRVHQFTSGEAAPAARDVLEMDPPACRSVWVLFHFSAGMFDPIVGDAEREAHFKRFQLMQQLGVFGFL